MSAYLQRTAPHKPGRHRGQPVRRAGRTLAALSPLPWLADGQYLPALIVSGVLLVAAVGLVILAVTL